MPSPRRLPQLGLAALLIGAIALRAHQSHVGLLYPDAYQYLLMARGIAEHGHPVLQLGAHGDKFVPNPDAAAKPLFPALVALLHLAGVSWITAARILAVTGAAGTVALVAALAWHLTRSLPAAALSAALCLASPALAYWSGFVGPDALATCLALAAALALLRGRFALGGLLAAGCIATRPEYLALALVAVLAASRSRSARPAAIRATTAAMFALALLLALIQPPLTAPGGRLVLVAGAATLAAVVLLAFVRSDRVPAAAWALASAAGLVVLALSGGSAGMRALLSTDWPLVALAVLGLSLTLRNRASRAQALSIVLGVVLLAGIYTAKNPGVERYLAQLVPALSLLAAVGLATLTWRPLALAAAVAVGATLLLVPRQPGVGLDDFAAVRPSLARTHGTVITAAPDAYGFLLYPRSVRALRPAEHGLIVLDAAQRAYEPEARARGALIARIETRNGFARPDGHLDRQPTLLVRGMVRAAK